MKQFWTVFRFEYRNYVKNRLFLITTILFVVVVGAVLSIPRFQDLNSRNEPQNGESGKTVIALVDKTGGDAAAAAAFFMKAMPDTKFETTAESESALKTKVDNGDCDGAVILNTPLTYTYVVKNIGMYDDFSERFQEVLLAKYRSDKLTRLGVSAADTGDILSAKVTSETVQTGSGKDQMKNYYYTYILIFALYMAILLYGQFVATSVATEKSNRAMELLITSTKPQNLMFGKVLGAGLAGLSQFVLIFGSSYLFYNLNKDYFKDDQVVQSVFNMPLNILLYAVLFFVLGFFIYAFLYGALGSLVSRMEELSNTIMPVNMAFVVAFMVVMFSMNSGLVDNTAMKVCSFIPFTSPMAMFVRIAMGNVAGWEIAVSVAVLIVSTVAVGFLAAAIYRMGVLLYGNAPKPNEIVKMLKNSR